MATDFLSFLGFMLFFAIVFGFAAYVRYLKHKETVQMIEKGIMKPPKTRNGLDSRKWGIVLTGLGIALCIGMYPFGYLVDDSPFPLNFGPWMLIGLLPMFFGLSLILINYINKKENGDNGEEE